MTEDNIARNAAQRKTDDTQIEYFSQQKLFFIILRIKDTHIAYDSLHTFHHPDVR